MIMSAVWLYVSFTAQISEPSRAWPEAARVIETPDLLPVADIWPEQSGPEAA